MPVGAGSIKRVAKAVAIEPAKEATTSKDTTKKITTKATATTRAKKTTDTKTADTKSTSTTEYNKVCHITEELPIYLL